MPNDITRQVEAIVKESGVQTGLGMFMYRVPLPES
jgi:thiamine phosphate synthase YjbQ (UPF0047 family)